MAAATAIEWCDATFNPWIGCTKVSPACDHCYAEADMDLRRHRVKWGAGQPRSRTSVANWKLPRRWNARPFWTCSACTWRGEGTSSYCPRCVSGVLVPARRRVFCASLADVFDNEVDPQWRADLFDLIAATPNLDWLLLTKRIGNVASMVPGTWRPLYPRNVWVGATIANQAEADRDLPKLAKLPACIRFLSMEPLLGPVGIGRWVDPWTCSNCGFHGSEDDTGPCTCDDCGVEAVYAEDIGSARCPECGKDDGTSDDVGGTCPKCESVRGWSRDYGFKFDSERRLIDWVIVGGESGVGARPMHPDWVRALRNQCAAAGVPFLFKQWGEWEPREEWSDLHLRTSPRKFERMTAVMPDGSPCPDDAVPQDVGAHRMACVGKKAAGRLLDGVEHNGFPEVRHG